MGAVTHRRSFIKGVLRTRMRTSQVQPHDAMLAGVTFVGDTSILAGAWF